MTGKPVKVPVNQCLVPDELPKKESDIYRLIRSRHCGQKQEHRCVGTISLTPNKVVMSCPLCGDAARKYAKEETNAGSRDPE